MRSARGCVYSPGFAVSLCRISSYATASLQSDVSWYLRDYLSVRTVRYPSSLMIQKIRSPNFAATVRMWFRCDNTQVAVMLETPSSPWTAHALTTSVVLTTTILPSNWWYFYLESSRKSIKESGKQYGEIHPVLISQWYDMIKDV